jgi:ribosomal protein L16 Arg81 hydroxylase
LTLVRGKNGSCYTQMLGWNALRQMIGRGEYPRGADHFRVAKESIQAPPARWMTVGKPDPDKLEQCLAEGYSVIITHIEPFLAPLAAICAEIKARLREEVYAGLIVTSGKDGAFRLHYDFEDLIIVQAEGSKRWQIYGPPVSNPVRGLPKPALPDGPPIFDEVLQTGDILFVPAGNWHHCEAGPGRSVHFSVFMLPPAGWHGVKRLILPLIEEEMFRTPLTRLAGASELAALETKIKNRMIEKINQLKLEELITKWGGKT